MSSACTRTTRSGSHSQPTSTRGCTANSKEPVNAAEFRRLVTHPAIQKHKDHLKLIVGGPGSWQIEKKNLQDEWGIDCIVDGEAEEIVVPLFESAIRGEGLPRKIEGKSPPMELIPTTNNRSIFGVVEVTRGCGRGCQFCSIALRKGRSLPLEHILENVRTQVAGGAETIMLTTEDIFLYEQGPKFDTNIPALRKLFESVAAVPGVKHVIQSHGTIAPIVRNPEVVDELSHIAVDKSIHRHPASTHPENRYASLFIGLETGSPRLFNQYMKGKAYPYKAEQWHDVVLKGMEIMNKKNWFPFCTWIIGLPGETDEDTKKSLDLLHALKDSKWVVIPTLFVSLDETRMGNQESAAARQDDRAAVGILLHVLALQSRLLSRRRHEGPTAIQHRRAALLLPDGPPDVRHGDEISGAPARAFPGEVISSKHLYLDLRKDAKYNIPEHVDIPIGTCPPGDPCAADLD